jgi:CDP-diacylglycerol--glycerol-3-phosphate 3-phosphatidyltransferase
MKRHVPFLLTTLRLILGPLALECACRGAPRWVYLPILLAGTLSDIFDGIIARRLGVATPGLRRYDSVTDMIYYLFILGATWVLCRPVLERNWLALALLLSSEALVILVCYTKFHQYPATHSILAKFYGLCLLGGLIAMLGFKAGDWAVITLATIALVANSEIIAIHLLSEKAPVDVKSIFALPPSGSK